MHISRITFTKNEVGVFVRDNYYVLPAAIELDSYYARHERGDGSLTEDCYKGKFYTFRNQDFYKLGKQLAKM